MCTVFGLKDAEQEFLVKNQVKLGLQDQITDKNRDNEGIEIATSAYKVIGLDIIFMICKLTYHLTYVLYDFRNEQSQNICISADAYIRRRVWV